MIKHLTLLIPDSVPPMSNSVLPGKARLRSSRLSQPQIPERHQRMYNRSLPQIRMTEQSFASG